MLIILKRLRVRNFIFSSCCQQRSSKKIKILKFQVIYVFSCNSLQSFETIFCFNLVYTDTVQEGVKSFVLKQEAL